MGKGIGAFIVGGLIGAGIALLYAPRPGVETRAIVSDKVNETWGQAQDLGAQASANVQQFYQDATAKGQEVASNVATKSQEVYNTAVNKGQELYENASKSVQEAASNVKPVFAEKNDDLREKIEAARARIAMQVAKNAEAAQELANDKIPVVADTVENATDKAATAAETAVTNVEGATESAVDNVANAVQNAAENADKSQG